LFKNLAQQARCLAKARGRSNMKKQRGAIAIEFAVLFLAFFMILYAIIAYSIPLLLILTFKQVSSDAGRAAIKVDQALPDAQYVQVVGKEVTRVIDSSWLPSDWVSGNCPTPKPSESSESSESPKKSLQWDALPGSPSYGYLAKEYLDEKSNNYRYILQVCLQRKKSIIPAINLMGIKIPTLPEEEGEVIIRNQTTVRL
jgi:hypothetical protein